MRLTGRRRLVDESLRLKAPSDGAAFFKGIRPGCANPSFTYGWDWVDVLPNIGIWRGVRIEAHSASPSHDVAM